MFFGPLRESFQGGVMLELLIYEEDDSVEFREVLIDVNIE
jgi:hypothetical protein